MDGEGGGKGDEDQKGFSLEGMPTGIIGPMQFLLEEETEALITFCGDKRDTGV